jgi:hypothetical protein
MPLPASSTSTAPLSSTTSTHDVFPPYLTVADPGVGSEPRQPQMRNLIA